MQLREECGRTGALSGRAGARAPWRAGKGMLTILFAISMTDVARGDDVAVPPATGANQREPSLPAPAPPDASPPSAAPSGPPPEVSYPQVAAPAATPVAARESTPLEPPAPVQEPQTHPLFGINAAVGAVFGGDNLMSATFTDGSTADLRAGRGAILSIGAMATPLWAGPVGLGLGADIGIKYTSITASNGTVSLTRFPLVLSAHALFDVSHHWFVLAAGGLHHELGVNLSGDGLASGLSVDFDSSWGGMGEVGAYYARRHLGGSGTIRYTSVHYSIGGQTFDASNVGIFGAIHYNFL
jgi:hypothetical protein